MRHGRDKILNGCSGSISLLRGLGSSRNGSVHPVSRWNLIPIGSFGARASVVIHTLDRYWKIVHPIKHRKYYRRWMLYAGLILSWLTGIRAYSKIDTCHWHNQNRQRTVPSDVILAVCIHECGMSLCSASVRNLSTDILTNHDAWNTLP